MLLLIHVLECTAVTFFLISLLAFYIITVMMLYVFLVNSPSGCTFWGKKPWSKKKKILWQLGTLIGAPIGIALIAGLSVPVLVFGLPIWAGRKVSNIYIKMR